MPAQPPSKTLVRDFAASFDALSGRVPDGTEVEFEARFNRGPQLTRSAFERVTRRLVGAGWSHSPAAYLLRVQSPQYPDVRIEVSGMAAISRFCTSESFADIRGSTTAIKKEKVKRGDADDLGLRLSIATETALGIESKDVAPFLAEWGTVDKNYRLLKRHRFTTPDGVAACDVSITKTTGRPAKNMKASRLADQPEKYEVEIEISRGDDTANEMRKCIMLVLSGLQMTSYPVTVGERALVIDEYRRLTGVSQTLPAPRQFLGPSSVTLQIENISAEHGSAVDVRTGYAVTDKADGLRSLLMVARSGRVYLIDTNMEACFTGCVASLDVAHTILDGERIMTGDNTSFMHRFAAFDVYYASGKDVRRLPLTAASPGGGARLAVLEKVVRQMRPEPVSGGGSAPLKVVAKQFYVPTGSDTIFDACSLLLKAEEQGAFGYETDGIIFTPLSLPVGASAAGEEPPKSRTTWAQSFKWKPYEQNTVDFLVTVQQAAAGGGSALHNAFRSGVKLQSEGGVTEYRTLILQVGYDESRHGFTDACRLVQAGERLSRKRGGDYKPMQFFPTDPSDDDAGVCHVAVERGDDSMPVLRAENGDPVESGMIVEFRYDPERDPKWRWIPVRVRYDKTEERRMGGKQFGNAYHVANGVWHALHAPITKAMLGSGKGVETDEAANNIYYAGSKAATATKAMRAFHNLYVKAKLITSAVPAGGTLVDLAVGRAGDLPKWVAAKAKLVVGIDLAADSISNRLDGACARYLNYRGNRRALPDVVYEVGDSSMSIVTGEAAASADGAASLATVFGRKALRGKPWAMARKHAGALRDGADACSVQFAIHYMFKDARTLYGFLSNVAQVTKTGGLFIGTTYDGAAVFDRLRGLPRGGALRATAPSDDGVIFEIEKSYSSEDFPPTVESIGYAIRVFNQSINKTFTEYLVNFTYFKEVMAAFGFAPLDAAEARSLGFPDGTPSFRAMYGKMRSDVATRDLASRVGRLTEDEELQSFLNRAFLFRKIRDVDIDMVTKSLPGGRPSPETKREQKDAQVAVSEAVAASEAARYSVRKLPRRILLRQRS